MSTVNVAEGLGVAVQSPKDVHDIEMNGLLWRAKKLSGWIWMGGFVCWMGVLYFVTLWLDWNPNIEVFASLVLAVVLSLLIETLITDRYYSTRSEAIWKKYEDATTTQH